MYKRQDYFCLGIAHLQILIPCKLRHQLICPVILAVQAVSYTHLDVYKRQSQGVAQEAVSICRIASVRITSTTYNDTITYLPAPTPTPTGCGADCEAAVRSYLPVGTAGASIKAGGQTVGQGTILVNEFGILVLVGANNSDPTFVSACKAEILTR